MFKEGFRNRISIVYLMKGLSKLLSVAITFVLLEFTWCKISKILGDLYHLTFWEDQNKMAVKAISELKLYLRTSKCLAWGSDGFLARKITRDFFKLRLWGSPRLLLQLRYAARNEGNTVNQHQGRRVGRLNFPPAERQQNDDDHWRQNPVI